MLYSIHIHKLHSPCIILVPKCVPMTAVERRLRGFGQGASMSLCHKQSAKGLHDHRMQESQLVSTLKAGIIYTILEHFLASIGILKR